MGHYLHYMARFISGFAVGFSSVWQLTLVTVAVVPLMALAGGTYAAVTVGLTGKSQKAYAEAGRVALEVSDFSLCRCYFFYLVTPLMYWFRNPSDSLHENFIYHKCSFVVGFSLSLSALADTHTY
jgi:uncharacterized membrane protein